MLDITNQKIFRLTAMRPDHKDSKGQWHWLFRCECGKEKVVNAVNVRNGQTKSCGCVRMGHVPDAEVRKKMSSAKIGKKQTDEHKEAAQAARRKTLAAPDYRSPMLGRTSPLRGKKFPERSGINSPCYITNRDLLVKNEKKHLDGKYREWMRAVKNRDGWRCRISNGDCSGRLEAHHILRWSEFPELRYKINNGITLCHAHHPTARAKEKRLIPFFQELVSVSSE